MEGHSPYFGLTEHGKLNCRNCVYITVTVIKVMEFLVLLPHPHLFGNLNLPFYFHQATHVPVERKTNCCR